MKNKFRALALLLASIMMITACGQTAKEESKSENPTSAASSNESTAASTDKASQEEKEEAEPVTINVATISRSVPMDDIYMTEYIEKTFNVDLVWTEYSNDAWNTQISLMLTTDDLPDLIVGANMDKGDVNKYGADGYFLNMMDYIDYMPNMKALMEEYTNWANYTVAPDGAIYGIARVFPAGIGTATGMTTFINNQWLENVGMDMPKTTEELYQVLKAFKEQDANGNGDATDEIPLGIQIDTGRGTRFEWMLLASYGYYTNNANYSPYVNEDGSVGLAQQDEVYKDYLKYLHKLYDEELMEQSAFIITDEERIDKTVNDKYGVFSEYSGLVTALGGAVEDNPYDDYTYISALTSEYNDQRNFALGNVGYAAGSRTYINAETEHPEIICQIIDYFLSFDNLAVADYGEEGVTFEYVEDDFGNMAPAYMNDYTKDTVAHNEGFNMIRTSVVNQIVESADDATLDAMISDEKMIYSASAVIEKELRTMDELIYPYPDLLYEDSSRVSVLKEDVGNVIKSYKASFILGEKDIDAEWDKYLSDLKAAGIEELLAMEADAYAAFANK